MFKHSLKVIAALLFGGLAYTALAQPGMFAAHMMPGFGSERMLDKMTSKLDLSEQQEQEIRSIMESAHDAIEEDRERLHELRGNLQEAVFDQAAVEEIADEIGNITSRMVVTGAGIRAAIHDVLTEEQREELKELHQERKGRWQKHRMRRQS